MDYIEKLYQDVMVVDTETTGLDYDSSEVIEVAGGHRTDGNWEVNQSLLRPNNSIPPEASAIHFISNRMVDNEKTFEDNINQIRDILGIRQSSPMVTHSSGDDQTKIMVAHNSEFDRKMLASEFNRIGADFSKFANKTSWICTWRLAKIVLGVNYDRMQYNLNFLRFYLDLDVPEHLTSHRADADVITCGRLFEHLVDAAIETNIVDPNQDLGEQLIELCWGHIPITIWGFGKHKGKPLVDVPIDYLLWAIGNMDILNEKNAKYDNDLAKSLEKILESRIV